MKKLAVLALSVVMLGCTMQSQQSAPATTPAPVVAATQGPPNPEFKNLQVLPRDLTRDQLITIMRSFNDGLGVRCDFCHVVTATEPRMQFDFPADTKEKKKAARVMIQTTMELNHTWIPRVKTALGEVEPAGAPEEIKVHCWTCHRGKSEPEDPPVPAPRT